jgi:hypothetical protein
LIDKVVAGELEESQPAAIDIKSPTPPIAAVGTAREPEAAHEREPENVHAGKAGGA